MAQPDRLAIYQRYFEVENNSFVDQGRSQIISYLQPELSLDRAELSSRQSLRRDARNILLILDAGIVGAAAAPLAAINAEVALGIIDPSSPANQAQFGGMLNIIALCGLELVAGVGSMHLAERFLNPRGRRIFT